MKNKKFLGFSQTFLRRRRSYSLKPYTHTALYTIPSICNVILLRPPVRFGSEPRLDVLYSLTCASKSFRNIARKKSKLLLASCKNVVCFFANLLSHFCQQKGSRASRAPCTSGRIIKFTIHNSHVPTERSPPIPDSDFSIVFFFLSFVHSSTVVISLSKSP